MDFIRPVLLTVAFLGGSSFAQQASNQYDGNWSGECGVPVDLEIHGQAGKWTPHANKGITKNNPCAAYAKPVDVQTATAERLVISVNGSAALQGCADVKMAFHASDATHLEIVRAPGATATYECTLSRR